MNKIKIQIRSIAKIVKQKMGPSFECPICGYIGAFASVKTKSGSRKFAVCLNCNAMERHRLQKLAFDKVTGELDLNNLDFLHISPEPCHREMLHGIGNYVTADLQMPDVDYHFDLQERAPFPDGLFDIVFASHVLEHILDDNHAIAEIRRIIKPGGFAILPVPIVSEATIDYGESNAFETGHVRAPGYDYFDRYRKHFDRVNEITSESFPEKYQLYLYEDRSIYPTSESPLRKPMPGVKHKDIVPICYV